MITVACVLRSGGDFTPEHVWALRRDLNKHLQQGAHEFRVLTDTPEFAGTQGIRLETACSGWWAKLELFRPGVFSGPVLYLDLDTVIVGSLDALASYRGSFAMLSDFYNPTALQSGIMAWTPSVQSARIWERFAANPERNIKTFRGDGDFIRALVEPRPERLQDLFPGQIVSYKRDVCLDRGSFVDTGRWRTPDGARVVCFHGQPRPWKTSMWKECGA